MREDPIISGGLFKLLLIPLPGGVLAERSRRQPARSSISASIFE